MTKEEVAAMLHAVLKREWDTWGGDMKDVSEMRLVDALPYTIALRVRGGGSEFLIEVRDA